MRCAIEDIAAERLRQIEAEGWSPEHDDAHNDFELSRAASGYAAMAWRRKEGSLLSPTAWPWGPEAWKPKDARSDLVRAGALIIAEIERLDRQAPTSSVADLDALGTVRLIAAAPELLAGLQWAVAQIGLFCEPNERAMGRLGEARAAIAKAMGASS